MLVSQVSKWSVDMGNVLVKNFTPAQRAEAAKIISEQDDGKLRRYLLRTSRLVPGAMEGLKEIIEKVGSENVWIVSRARDNERAVNRAILSAHRFWPLTGLHSSKVRFVDEWRQKADVCQELGVAGHIDDRGEVLAAMNGVVPVRIWFSPSKDNWLKCKDIFHGQITIARGWREIIRALSS